MNWFDVVMKMCHKSLQCYGNYELILICSCLLNRLWIQSMIYSWGCSQTDLKYGPSDRCDYGCMHALVARCGPLIPPPIWVAFSFPRTPQFMRVISLGGLRRRMGLCRWDADGDGMEGNKRVRQGTSYLQANELNPILLAPVGTCRLRRYNINVVL